MNIFSQYINFDLLKIPISFSYRKRYLYRTFIGSTLTIIGFIILLIYFSVKLNQIINKSLFTIISNEFQNPKDEINLTNIPILFSISDNNGNPIEIDSKMFELSAVLREYMKNFDEDNRITYTEEEIQIEKCDNLKDIIDFSDFSEYNISYFRCIRPYQNIKIKGRYGDIINGYTTLNINIKKCNNISENCYNSNYIESYVSKTKLVVIYLGYKANFYNNSNKKDLERAIYTRSISLSPFLFKKILYYLTLVKYDNYDNFVFDSKKEEIYFINRDMLVDIIPKIDSLSDIEDNDTFAFFSFVYDGNMIKYTKKVEQLGEIISYIGNFFNIMLTLFKIINNYFSKKVLFTDVFYNIFFDEKFKKKEKNVHFNNFNNSNLFPLIHKKMNNMKLNPKIQDRSIKSINSNININSFIPDRTFENDNNKCYNQNPKNGLRRILTNKSKVLEKEKINFKRESKFYYFCPLWVIRSRKNLNQLLVIKESICNSFSLESFIELIKIKKTINLLKKEREMFSHRRNHLSDKSVMKNEIKEILYYK